MSTLSDAAVTPEALVSETFNTQAPSLKRDTLNFGSAIAVTTFLFAAVALFGGDALTGVGNEAATIAGNVLLVLGALWTALGIAISGYVAYVVTRKG